MLEIEKEKRKPLYCPGKRGTDRSRMIEELQEINHFGDKKLMDAQIQRDLEMRRQAKISALQPVDNQTRLRAKYGGQYASNALTHYEGKYGVKATKLLFNETGIKQARTDQDEEL